ncbi:recombinase family protein [Paenarthrobacter nitroguajacolicus]|uniref:recombinase family protein n=1 Tax=Paenarthrobacter nitroguajacolicus TaxID=211146 RepID=UPI0015B86391|nr:recombinase family protein [Paenarthrobacter nitroguajacolicus]
MAKSPDPIALGWARVSTDKEDKREQTLEQQIDALLKYGVPAENIYKDKISGTISLDRSEEWAALSERALAPSQPVEIVLASWSRLSRDFWKFLAAVNHYASEGCVFTILGDPRYQRYAPRDSADGLMLAIEAFGSTSLREKISIATKAKLDYLKSQGIKLGRPEKLTLADCDEINRLAQLEDFKNPRLIAEEISAHRLAAIPEGLDDPERERAEKHARVSRPIVYRYLALTGLAESDFMLIDVLRSQHGDDCEAIAKDLTAARIASIPEETADDEEAYAKALKASTVLRSSVYRYLAKEAADA